MTVWLADIGRDELMHPKRKVSAHKQTRRNKGVFIASGKNVSRTSSMQAVFQVWLAS
tara:strand:- start:363 stop:533 length:171 start_codon:yes stop_codon:yes gene_type:complete